MDTHLKKMYQIILCVHSIHRTICHIHDFRRDVNFRQNNFFDDFIFAIDVIIDCHRFLHGQIEINRKLSEVHSVKKKIKNLI